MTDTVSRRQRAAGTEAALKQAAREVFAERGYLNTKITDITAAAGRATGSFYNHFASKEELLEALLKDMLAEADEAGGATTPATTPTSARLSAIRWHVAAFWRFYQAHLPEMIAVKQAAMADPELGRRLQQIMADDDQHMIEHFAHLPNPPADPLVEISAMNALLEGFAYTWLVVNPPNGQTITDDERDRHPHQPPPPRPGRRASNDRLHVRRTPDAHNEKICWACWGGIVADIESVQPKVPLGRKVRAGLGALLALLVILTGVAIALVVNLSRGETRVKDDVPYTTAIASASLDAKSVANDQRGFLLTGDVMYLREADQRSADARREFAIAVRTATTDEQRRAASESSAGFDRWWTATRAEFATYRAGNKQAAIAASLGPDRELRKQYEESLQRTRALVRPRCSPPRAGCLAPRRGPSSSWSAAFSRPFWPAASSRTGSCGRCPRHSSSSRRS